MKIIHKCHLCLKMFKNKKGLSNHLRWHNGLAKKIIETQGVKDKQTTPQKRYMLRNREKYNLWSKQYQRRLREIALFVLGEKCKICGFTDERALQVDHIKAIGNRYRMRSSNVYKDVIQNPKKYQLLCANCNWIKRVEKGEYLLKS